MFPVQFAVDLNGFAVAKEPNDRAWIHCARVPVANGGLGTMWQLGKIRVLSALEYAKLPGQEVVGPQWHISITALGLRPKHHHVRKALRAFGMVGAELDNHHPGNAQHYWMPVDPAARVACECKEDEIVVKEKDGYTWQNDPDDCRGCELQRLLGTPCRLHPAIP